MFACTLTKAPREVTKKPQTLGSADPDVIRKVLKESFPEMQKCYEGKEVETFVLLFTIVKTGKTADVKVTESKMSEKSKICIKKVVLGLTFPKPFRGGKVDVSQPIRFHPSK